LSTFKHKKLKICKGIVLPVLSYWFENGMLRKTFIPGARKEQEDGHVHSAELHNIFGINRRYKKSRQHFRQKT
jgi:hypothetical protein